jgi:hypothetical protein
MTISIEMPYTIHEVDDFKSRYPIAKVCEMMKILI